MTTAIQMPIKNWKLNFYSWCFFFSSSSFDWTINSSWEEKQYFTQRSSFILLILYYSVLYSTNKMQRWILNFFSCTWHLGNKLKENKSKTRNRYTQKKIFVFHLVYCLTARQDYPYQNVYIFSSIIRFVAIKSVLNLNLLCVFQFFLSSFYQIKRKNNNKIE